MFSYLCHTEDGQSRPYSRELNLALGEVGLGSWEGISRPWDAPPECLFVHLGTPQGGATRFTMGALGPMVP